jgi:hypothetical protein
MRRRGFITLLGGVLTWPLAAGAQQPDRVRRIGVLMVLTEADPQSRARVSVSGGRGEAEVDGRSQSCNRLPVGCFQPRAGTGRHHGFTGLAPDLMLANSVAAVRVAQQARARFRSCSPGSASRSPRASLRAWRVPVATPQDSRIWSRAWAASGRGCSTRSRRASARNRLPAIYPFGFFAAAGGLISYGLDVRFQFRRSVTYVDRILRSETPGDLPVQKPTKADQVRVRYQP